MKIKQKRRGEEKRIRGEKKSRVVESRVLGRRVGGEEYGVDRSDK